jgi:hypothetical protein
MGEDPGDYDGTSLLCGGWVVTVHCLSQVLQEEGGMGKLMVLDFLMEKAGLYSIDCSKL